MVRMSETSPKPLLFADDLPKLVRELPMLFHSLDVLVEILKSAPNPADGLVPVLVFDIVRPTTYDLTFTLGQQGTSRHASRFTLIHDIQYWRWVDNGCVSIPKVGAIDTTFMVMGLIGRGMSAELAQTDPDALLETDCGVEAAYEAVGEALQELDVGEHTDQYIALQERYFGLRAAMLARDDDFQAVDLGGTDLHVPAVHRPVENPVASDEHGEVEAPTRFDNFRVLDSIEVCDPDNPHVTHHVSVDHVLDTDGEVQLEVNANTLDELP